MPQKMEEILEKSNITLTAIFTVEMLLKLIGLGFWEYVDDGFNNFDAIIVVLALVELASVGGGSGLSAR